MIADPRLTLLLRALDQRPALRLPRPPGVAEAAVSLVLRPRDSLELLLIERAEHEHDPWSGHMALPGGRRDVGDVDLVDTAVRETAEETAVELDRTGRILGGLDDVGTRSPHLPSLVIAPLVAAVPPETRAVPESREVADIVWIPVGALRDREAMSEIVIELDDGRRAFPSIQYGERVIWGLTHRILLQFLDLVDACGL